MVDEKILRRFCAAEDGRYAMTEPVVVGGWRYCYDGRVIVRVPATGEPDTKFPDGKMVAPVAGLDWASAKGTGTPWPKPGFVFVEKMVKCDNSEGTGFGYLECKAEHRTFLPDVEAQKVGDVYVAAKYVVLIGTLPKAEYYGAKKPTGPMWFRFDGGEGMVMGMSPDAYDSGAAAFCVAPE